MRLPRPSRAPSLLLKEHRRLPVLVQRSRAPSSPVRLSRTSSPRSSPGAEHGLSAMAPSRGTDRLHRPRDDPPTVPGRDRPRCGPTTAGMPIKLLKTGLTFGSVGDLGDHRGSDRPGSGDGDQFSPVNGRPLSGESSPWPRDGDATPPTGERFDHGLDILRESLLDPNRYRDTPSPQPDRPSSGNDGTPAPRNQNTGTPENGGDTPCVQPPPQRGRRTTTHHWIPDLPDR